MATEASPQRAYRAACPNCGAPVEFRSAASALAVCSFCKSTLVREGDDLRRIGQSADLFDDHSPLQLGASGNWQGAAFTLVGRLQVRYAGGSWNEWHALFDNTTAGWLSEDNGGYVFSFESPPPAGLPAPEVLRVGATLALERSTWSVASVTTAKLGAAEGELPFVPTLERAYIVAELRSPRGEVASIDYGPRSEGQPARWYVGRGLQLAELALAGLREVGEKSLGGRSLQCPNCGAALEVQLATTQSITCHQCKSVVDVSQGVGADLQHYAQDTPGGVQSGQGGEPLLPLGSTGVLTLGAGGAQPWQVVGYVERCTVPGAGDDDEQSFWREYLLYNQKAGFAFIVDTEDGWSWVRPLTGAPVVKGNSAQWQDMGYRELYRYTGQITYVLGEFYWKLERGQRTFNTDYQGPGGRKLNREQTGEQASPGRPKTLGAPSGGRSEATWGLSPGADAEVTWSAGEALDAAVLMKAFKLQDDRRAAVLRDVKPLTGSGSGLTLPLFFLILLVIVIVFALSRCSGDDCDDLRRSYGESSNEYQQCARGNSSGGYRSGGGSFGGFSSGGGGHK